MSTIATGIEVKTTIGLVVKTLSLPAVALFFSPIYDLIILQVVTDYSLLTDFQKSVINDIKLIGGAVVMVLALIRLILSTYKIRKEIKVLNKE